MLAAQGIYGKSPRLDSSGQISLGLTLYPTLPEDRFDKQPLEHDEFRLVADVRIDNRDELGRELGIEPQRLARLADSSLLFECLLTWGEEAVPRIAGEFAFAFWSGRANHLLLGRDLLGERPLFFHQGSDFFAFSSMPVGLLSLPCVPRECDSEVIGDTVALLPYVGRRSYFRGIERVQPGHLVRVARDKVTASPYWTAPRVQDRSREETIHGLRQVVEEAVRSRLRGCGDFVGTHLSAGLDSSIVTATVARQFAPKTVFAFTASPRTGFSGSVPPETIADESPFAAETASLYSNIEHVVVESGSEDLMDVLNRQYSYMQEPTTSAVQAAWGRDTYRAARSRGLKVLLVGFRGNMTISYSGMESWSSMVAKGRLISALRIGAKLFASGIPFRTLAAQALGALLPSRIWMIACRAFGRPVDLSEYTALRKEERDRVEKKAEEIEEDLLYRPSTDATRYRLDALFDGDNGSYFKGVLAEFGLSISDPLSDKRVIEYCFSIPAEEFIRDGVQRGLAREAFADRLPTRIAGLLKRGYQAADWYELVARDMPSLEAELDAISRCAGAHDCLDVSWLKHTIKTWPSSDWHRRDRVYRYRHGLLRGFGAGHFMRKVAGTN